MFHLKLSTLMTARAGQCLPPARMAAVSRQLTLVVLVAAAGLAGCASSTPEDPTSEWSPNRIYKEAKDEFDSGKFDKAALLYEKLEGRAAGTPLGQQAQLERAYALYLNGEQAKAIAAIDRFLKLHPTSPALDYALYLKGTVTFADKLGIFGNWVAQDLSERDQNAAKESFLAYRDLVTKFPNSKYTPDASKRLTYIVNSLASYEVHVARYYMTRKAYVAAINRAQQAITDYRDAPALEEAMAIVVDAYDAMGMTALRDDAKRVMDKSFPEGAAAGRPTRNTSWWKFW
jgi:outer membrane protein assembly factor BamD